MCRPSGGVSSSRSRAGLQAQEIRFNSQRADRGRHLTMRSLSTQEKAATVNVILSEAERSRRVSSVCPN